MLAKIVIPFFLNQTPRHSNPILFATAACRLRIDLFSNSFPNITQKIETIMYIKSRFLFYIHKCTKKPERWKYFFYIAEKNKKNALNYNYFFVFCTQSFTLLRADFLKIKYINVVLAFSRNKKDFYPNAKFFILFILFFQVAVFVNMPSLLSNLNWVHQVMDVVEHSLIDERVEVRSKASEVLGGLLHCAFVDKERSEILLVSGFFLKNRILIWYF